MVMKNKIVIAIVFATCCISCRTEREKELDSALESLANVNVFYYKPVDNFECDKIRWCLTKIDSLATDKELEKLAIRNQDPTIRLYAFQLMLHRKNESYMDIALQKIRDSSKVIVRDFYGFCGTYADMVSNICVNMLVKSLKCMHDTLKLNRLDSVLLYSPDAKGILYYKELFLKLPPKIEYYKYVRRHYLEQHNFYALLALAKYHKKEDKYQINRLLLNFRNHIDLACGFEQPFSIALLAIQQWPDDYFISALKRASYHYLYADVMFSNTLKYFLGALMAYDEDWSYQIIKNSIKNMRKKGNMLDVEILQEKVREAYLVNPHPRYKSLFK